MLYSRPNWYTQTHMYFAIGLTSLLRWLTNFSIVHHFSVYISLYRIVVSYLVLTKFLTHHRDSSPRSYCFRHKLYNSTQCWFTNDHSLPCTYLQLSSSFPPPMSALRSKWLPLQIPICTTLLITCGKITVISSVFTKFFVLYANLVCRPSRVD